MSESPDSGSCRKEPGFRRRTRAERVTPSRQRRDAELGVIEKGLSVDEQSVEQFQREQPMNFDGEVASAAQVGVNGSFDDGPVDVRALKRPPIQQHVAHIFREYVAIPDSKVINLVPA